MDRLSDNVLNLTPIFQRWSYNLRLSILILIKYNPDFNKSRYNADAKRL